MLQRPDALRQIDAAFADQPVVLTLGDANPNAAAISVAAGNKETIRGTF